MAQLIEAGKKVVDNPTHLADFGAALTSGESQQLQAVLESTKVLREGERVRERESERKRRKEGGRGRDEGEEGVTCIDTRAADVNTGAIEKGVSCCNFTAKTWKRSMYDKIIANSTFIPVKLKLSVC